MIDASEARWAQTAAGCALIGWLAFHAWVWRRELVGGRAWVARGLALVFLGAGVLALAAQSALVSADPAAFTRPQTWAKVMNETMFGLVWRWRHGLMGLVLVGTMLKSSRQLGWKSDMVLAVAIIAVALGALSGHAAAVEQPALTILLQALHLITVGLWWGGLVALAVLARARDTHGFAQVFRRFSRLATLCMSIALPTGVYLSWVHVADWPALFGTPYGQVLLLKIATVMIVLCLAAWLRWGWLARIHTLSASSIARPMPVWIMTEWIIAAVVLVCAAVLAGTPPARHEQVVWPFNFRFAPQVAWTQPDVPMYFTSGAALLALAVGLLALARGRDFKAWLMGAGAVLAAVGGVLMLNAIAIPAFPDTYRVSAVPYHAISIDTGAALFRRHCIQCHGPGGVGDGPLAGSLPIRPTDLSAPHTADHTAGDLFWWLTHGMPSGAMPGFASVLDEEARWDLINFLRAFATGYQARILRPQIAPRQPWLGAPDFNYTTQAGAQGALKALRGAQALWLVLFTWPESSARLRQLNAALPELERSGAQLLALPIAALHAALPADIHVPIATEGVRESVATYLLFRRTLSHPDAGDKAPLPSHMELLVDRFGYLRARWLPAESAHWADVANVMHELSALAAEPEILPPPDEHLH